MSGLPVIFHILSGEPVEGPSSPPCGATDGGVHHRAPPPDGARAHG